jgi:deazaflavin-dependent oxidoreductase (nitroreductase family)
MTVTIGSPAQAAAEPDPLSLIEAGAWAQAGRPILPRRVVTPASLSPLAHEPSSDAAALPYGPRMIRRLAAVRRLFRVVDHWFAAPAIRAGLGPYISTPAAGSLMLLRTTGRSTGLRRESPLAYLIADGVVYCCAGFGARTAWYRNLCADPRVEVVLPTMAFSGIAETVTDGAEWDRIFPRYARALGIFGRLTLGDIEAADASRLAILRESLPLVRIRATGLAPGPADPGGWSWIASQVIVILVLRRIVMRLVRRT